ncbi:hypothetical protein J2S09_001291 [Bacillus fengqiuensis]|nr:hypothetical protein [Bacillus fengqiuensis]
MNIVVTFLTPKAEMKQRDMEIPNHVPARLLIEKLFLKIGTVNPLDIDLYDLEFSIEQQGWQKVEKYYSLSDVGVWDGVYIRLVKQSAAVSAPRLSFTSAQEEKTHTPVLTRQDRGSDSPGEQEAQGWKIIG